MLRLKIRKGDNQEIVKKAISVLLLRVFGYLFGFIFTWIVTNQYGPKAQGIFSIAFLFLSLGTMFSKLGLETSIVKWVASRDSIEEQLYIYKRTMRMSLISSFIISVVLYFGSSAISLMYSKPDIEESLKLAAFGIPLLTVLDVTSNFFKGQKKTTFFAIYYHFGKFFMPLIFLSCYYFANNFNFDVPMISYTFGLSFILGVVITHVLLMMKSIKSKKILITNKQMFLESYPMLVASSIVMVMGWSDVFILGFYVDEHDIGLYSTAVKLATIVSFTYNAIATITSPKIAEYYSKSDKTRFKSIVKFSANIMFYTSLLPFFVLFVFPEYFLGWFGDEFRHSSCVFRILLIAQFCNVLTGPVGPIFQMTNNQHKLQKFIIIALIVNVVLSLLLVNFIKMEGVAIGSAFGMFLWNFLGAVFIYKRMGIKTWATLKA